MIKPMGMVNICHLTGQFMRVSGQTINAMEKGKKFGQMEPYSKDTMKKIKKMGRASSNGQMGVHI